MTKAGDLEGVEVVRRVLDAFNRRDSEAILELVHPDARFVSMTGQLLREGAAYVGRDGLLEYFADAERLWQGLQVEPREIQAAGDGVVVIGYVHAHTDAGELRLPVVWTWRLRDGLIAECVVHSDAAAARRALGIDDH